MAKVILICGRIASGKTHYARRIANEVNAVVLSCDELMFALGLENTGERFDMYSDRGNKYLYARACDIAHCGANVILDFGFWNRTDRAEVTEYFAARGVEVEWHYIDISPQDWRRNIESRNARVKAGDCEAFYVDEGLLAKLERIFEVPERAEMDVWFKNRPYES